MVYVHYQPLNGQKPTINEDCLIRAISRWLFIPNEKSFLFAWQSAVYFAARMSYEEHMFPANMQACITSYFEHHGCEIKTLERRRTVASIAKDLHEPAFLIVADHIVFAKDGKYYDSWDSGRKVVKKIIFLKDYKEESNLIWGEEY